MGFDDLAPSLPHKGVSCLKRADAVLCPPLDLSLLGPILLPHRPFPNDSFISQYRPYMKATKKASAITNLVCGVQITRYGIFSPFSLFDRVWTDQKLTACRTYA